MKNKYLNWIIFCLFMVLVPLVYGVESSLSYDTNGNLVTGDGKYRTYNSLNQLWKVYNGTNTSVLLEEYTYHPIEERVIMKKVYNTSGSVIETTYYISQNYVQVVNLSGTFNYTYYYLQGQLVAQDMNGTKMYYNTDVKGDVIALTNASGNVTETNFYSPTGEITLGGNKSKYTYEGKELDKVSGMTDYNARMYASTIDIFGQPDTNIQNPFNPQDLNHYVYLRNNPFKYADPDGKDAWLIIDPTLAGGYGHVAIIVGNDEGGYRAYSQGATGGEEAVRQQTSVSANTEGGVYVSENYQTKDKAIKGLESNQGGKYSETIHFETTSKQDQLMYQTAVTLQGEYSSGEKKYNVITSNCAGFTSAVLKSGGIDTKGGFLDVIPKNYVSSNVQRYSSYSSMISRQSIFSKITTSIKNIFSSKISSIKRVF